MLNKLIAVVFIFAIFFSSCSNNDSNMNKNNQDLIKAQTFNILEQQQLIYDFEQKLRKDNSGVFSEAQALSISNLYSDYIKNFPNDTSFTPKYLFKLSQIQITLKQGKEAIGNLDKLIARFPSNQYVPNAYFLKAFTYDNVLKESDNATRFYKTFIEKYPNHNLAESAKASISVAGKSEEELLKMIHAKNK
jgi:TolA-binding protein